MQRVEMEEKIIHDLLFCLLFMLAVSLMFTCMSTAFDTQQMSSVHHMLFDSVRTQRNQSCMSCRHTTTLHPPRRQDY